MKSMFLVLGLMVSNLLYSQIPDLAKRTLEGKLNEDDFETSSKYLVNIDTLNWGQGGFSGELNWYQEKKGILNKVKELSYTLKCKKVDYFIELNNNSFFYPSKKHWFMMIGNYRIDWWFSVKDVNKIESITLIKKETGI